MSIPDFCDVLVVGGGPAGSYAASVLAREGFSTVVLEAEKFPRYHVGESMLPSMRHFLRFIDLDSTFDKFGFYIKKGATFKMNNSQPAPFTDFIAAGGPQGYTWNVKRSDADDLIFRHAGYCGASVFDEVQVDTLQFRSNSKNAADASFDSANPLPPVSAKWSRKSGQSGLIQFKYLIDASGRYGLMSNKYLKNRQYNQGFKNVANWGYWTGTGTYGTGLREEGWPYFEHLQDRSGWAWFIPLHDGTTSVGVVMNQDVAASKRRRMIQPSTRNFYQQTLENEVPGIRNLLCNAELGSQKIHTASDWSYSAHAYASPNVRIAGDAGCFIDPFFSSGVHLAFTTGLSAATTIASSLKGDCSEQEAGEWHTAKVKEVYTRFLLVVSVGQKQIRQGEDDVLNDFDETGFDRAFARFRPIIQGAADMGAKLTHDELSKTLDFCVSAFTRKDPGQQKAVLNKLDDMNIDVFNADCSHAETSQELATVLSSDEMRVLATIRAREMLKREEILDSIDTFKTDAINGFVAKLKRGHLGLVKTLPDSSPRRRKNIDAIGLMMREGETPADRSRVSATRLSTEGKRNENIPVAKL